MRPVFVPIGCSPKRDEQNIVSRRMDALKHELLRRQSRVALSKTRRPDGEYSNDEAPLRQSHVAIICVSYAGESRKLHVCNLPYNLEMAFAGAAAAAAIANAIKASGVLVRLDPAEFVKILARTSSPLVVTAKGGIFSDNFKYLLSYKGLAFYTKSDEAIALPPDAEIVPARGIKIPD